MIKLKPLALAAVIAAVPLQNQAATNTVKDGYTDDDASLDFTNWSTTLSLPQHDPSLGTLTNVKLTYFSQALVQGTVSNPLPDEDGNERTLIINENVETVLVTADIPAAEADITIAFSKTETFNDVPGQGEETIEGIDENDTEVRNYSSAAQLAYFTGSGTVDFPATGEGSVELGEGSGNAATEITTQAGVSVELEYEFSPPSVSCTASIGESGGLINVNSEGGVCDTITYTTTLTCSGDYTGSTFGGSSNTSGACGTDPANVNGVSSFDTGCDPGESHTTSFSNNLAGESGACTVTVTALQCGDSSFDGCQGSFAKQPPQPGVPGPVENPKIPTMTQWGLMILAGILGLLGVRASRRRG